MANRKIGKSQRERFVETARELECDEDEAAFDETMDRVALKKDAPREERDAPKGSD